MSNPATEQTFDVIVVGGGVMGAATTLASSKAGKKTLLIDQFEPPHTHGSSHGQTRLLRVAYAEGEKFVPIVRRAIDLWKELARDAGQDIFRQTGVVYAGSPNSTFISSALESARSHDVDIKEVDRSSSGKQRNFRAIPEDWSIFQESEGGYVLVEASVAAMIGSALKKGASTEFGQKVVAIEEASQTVRVKTESGTFEAGVAVVAAGPWVSDLVPLIGDKTQVQRKLLHWYEADSSFDACGDFQPFAFNDERGDEWFYGFPAVDGFGVKVADHRFGQDIDHPDDLDRSIHASDVDHMDDLVSRFFPMLGPRTKSAVCMYTSTENEDFLMDRVPGSDKVFVCAGFSGHGYKFATAIGEVMANLATGEPVAFDLGPFRVA